MDADKIVVEKMKRHRGHGSGALGVWFAKYNIPENCQGGIVKFPRRTFVHLGLVA